jgi:broad specificity phosphatase PhoE
MCGSGEVDKQVKDLMNELPDVDVDKMVSTSTARQFPHRQLASSSEASPLKAIKSVRDLATVNGECLLFLERATNVPYADAIRDLTCQAVTTRAHGEPSVRAWAEDADGKLVGKVAEWPSKHCNTAPSWYTAYSLGFPMGHEGVSRLNIELRDGSALIASCTVPYADLPGHSMVHKEMDIRPPASQTGDRPCSVTFQVIDSAEVLAKRTVYFVRHGESSWNKAQSKLDLYEMGRQTDHPLSSKGREQAEELSSLVNEAQDNDLLHPDVIYVSPLTRAIQTAVIGLRSVLAQPDFGHLVLMANAREKQNFGGFDSKPCCTGSNVLKRTLDELVLLYKGQKGADEVVKAFQKLKIDTAEVEDRWWHNVQAESPAQLKGRLSEFMAQLKYSPYKSIVVVGHSHFFRAVFKEFVSDSFKERRKDFADQLSKMKLSNCGVARLSLDPSVEQGGPITDVELILGTHLDADGGLCKCQGPPPRLDENEVRTKDK